MNRPSRRLRTLLLLTALALLSMPRPACAQTPEQQAEALAARAVGMARNGDLTRAVQLFEAAYALDPAPMLLYNVGRVKARLGDVAGARDALERYVELEPDPEARQRGREALAELGAAPLPATVLVRPPSPSLAEPSTAAPEPPRADLPPVTTEAPAPPTDRTWLWVGVGAGAAVLVAGGITAAVLLSGRGAQGSADGVMRVPLGVAP